MQEMGIGNSQMSAQLASMSAENQASHNLNMFFCIFCILCAALYFFRYSILVKTFEFLKRLYVCVGLE